MINQEPFNYIDTKQSANLLGYGQRHLIRLCNEHAIAGAIKKGGQWQIPVITIEQLRAEKKNLTTERIKIINLLKPYVLLHLASEGKRMREVKEEILQLKEQPIIDDASKFLIREFENKLAGQVRYFQEILRNLDAAENSISTKKEKQNENPNTQNNTDYLWNFYGRARNRIAAEYAPEIAERFL
jgi:hypothetical protein